VAQIVEPEALRQSGLGHAFGTNALIDGRCPPQRRPFGALKIKSS
jgi:hypothetical protein